MRDLRARPWVNIFTIRQTYLIMDPLGSFHNVFRGILLFKQIRGLLIVIIGKHLIYCLKNIRAILCFATPPNIWYFRIIVVLRKRFNNMLIIEKFKRACTHTHKYCCLIFITTKKSILSTGCIFQNNNVRDLVSKICLSAHEPAEVVSQKCILLEGTFKYIPIKCGNLQMKI